ncbi:hypothetical protein BE20_25165 [Sorangium cellulosum]|uniref:Uncharacterized protein n=1 Tax=Sorangium cellulosum TaxID=56 RepID=A0A150RFN4_SORCE|nr:hypothetical protein BE18_17530 [Sorangium cellulosum]KYF87724.1 hypothetical protein BE20_25165 [Sorangium cellulosum]
MLLAQLHGKLTRSEEDLEDLLTSHVFGALKYSGRLDVLHRFLTGALLQRDPGTHLALGEIAVCTYRFWPWLCTGDGVGCEPDLVLELQHPGGTGTLVAIEAKYKHGKSRLPTPGGHDDPVNDQLAREWLCVHDEARRGGYARAHLVYLTADLVMPRAALDEADDELRRKGRPGAELAWLSWRRLTRLLDTALEPILVDLAALLRRAALTFFEGVDRPRHASPIPYVFAPDIRGIDASHAAPGSAALTWPRPPRARPYAFDRSGVFQWPAAPAPRGRSWRFVP